MATFEEVRDLPYVNWDSENGYYGSENACTYCEYETPGTELSEDGVPVCSSCAESERRQREHENALDYWRLEGENAALEGTGEDPPSDNMAFCVAYRQGFRSINHSKR